MVDTNRPKTERIARLRALACGILPCILAFLACPALAHAEVPGDVPEPAPVEVAPPSTEGAEAPSSDPTSAVVEGTESSSVTHPDRGHVPSPPSLRGEDGWKAEERGDAASRIGQTTQKSVVFLALLTLLACFVLLHPGARSRVRTMLAKVPGAPLHDEGENPFPMHELNSIPMGMRHRMSAYLVGDHTLLMTIGPEGPRPVALLPPDGRGEGELLSSFEKEGDMNASFGQILKGSSDPMQAQVKTPTTKPPGGRIVGLLPLLLLPLLAWLLPGEALAQSVDELVSTIPLGDNEELVTPPTAIKILVLMTLISLVPSALLSMTAFTRIIIVLGFMRQAIGVQNLPPNQVLIAMALFLTTFVMGPEITSLNDAAVQPYIDGQADHMEAWDSAEPILRDFMSRQTREADMALFLDLAGYTEDRWPTSIEEIPLRVVLPAYLLSEVKTAFTIGFLLFIPFLLVDFLVSTVLLSMGMMMLPPVVISLPFKLLLFVFVDGWTLLVSALVQGFH